jgi:hypothetical protein
MTTATLSFRDSATEAGLTTVSGRASNRRFIFDTNKHGYVEVPVENLPAFMAFAQQEGEERIFRAQVAERAHLEQHVRGRLSRVLWHRAHHVNAAKNSQKWVTLSDWMSGTEATIRMAGQIADAVEDLERHWLVFQGEEAINLLRRVQQLDKKPILMVHCERGMGIGAHTYEGYVPNGFSISYGNRLMTVSGNLEVLYWSPDTSWHADGKHITAVYTLPQYFDAQAVNAVKISELGF